MTQPKILAFAGSLRKNSFNRKLVRIAASGAEKAGATTTVIDLADYPLPVFDEDLEARDGLPEAAVRLKALFHDHHGLLVASPEYNSSFSAALKNAIDWISRSEPGREPLSGFADKVAGIMATSPGGLGGLRGLVHLRSMLSSIRVVVVPHQVAVPGAHQAFDDHGGLADEKKRASVEQIGADVAGMLIKLLA